jgi:hypothetical protein
MDSEMSSCKKTTSKAPTTKASGSRSRQKEDPNSPGIVYNDTTWLLEKWEDPLKRGEAFQMFKKKNFLMDA